MSAATLPAVGDAGPRTLIGPISRTDIVRYAGASGDFNPLHHDEQIARAVGFPTVFAMGMFQAGLLASYATGWLGADTVRRFAVRFKEQVWPEDVLVCEGEVAGVEPVDGGHLVTVMLTCSRKSGGVALAGTADFLLPLDRGPESSTA